MGSKKRNERKTQTRHQETRATQDLNGEAPNMYVAMKITSNTGKIKGR